MTPQNFSVIFTLFTFIVFLIYYLRKSMIQGIFHLAHIHFYNTLLITGFTLLNWFIVKFSTEQYFVGCTVILLVSFLLSFIAPLHTQLQKHMARQWYISCVWIVLSVLLSSLIATVYIGAVDNKVDLGIPTSNLLALGLAYFIVSYFSVILLRYYAELKKQRDIGNYITPIVQSLNHELDDFNSQLSGYQACPQPEDSSMEQMLTVLSEKVQHAKLPVYSNDLTLSMAVLPFMTATSKENTWIDSKGLQMPAEELALLLSLICRYLQALDPAGLIGIQRTIYTDYQLVFAIHEKPFTAQTLAAFIKKRRFKTTSGKIPDHSYYAVCFNWLIASRHLKLRYQINPDATIHLIVTGA